MISNKLFKLTVIQVLILFLTVINAQEDSSKTAQGVNIYFVNGYAISYKWNTSKNLSYRIYLTLSSSLFSEETEIEWNSTDTINNGNTEGNEDRKFFGANLSFQFLFNIFSNKTFTAYAGIGPYFSYSHSFGKHDNSRNPNYYQAKSTFSANDYRTGLIALFGVEAFLTSNISLYSEMHLSGGKTWTFFNGTSWNSTDKKSVSNETRTGWNLDFQLVKIGLGLYF